MASIDHGHEKRELPKTPVICLLASSGQGE